MAELVDETAEGRGEAAAFRTPEKLQPLVVCRNCHGSINHGTWLTGKILLYIVYLSKLALNVHI